MHIQSATPATPTTTQKVWWPVLGAIAGPILFVLCWLALTPLHPGYSTVSQPISALAVGPNGVFMRAAFLLNGLLVTVGVIAAVRSLRPELGAAARWTTTLLLLISPLGVLWAGIFTTDTLALHNIGVEAATAGAVIAFPLAGLVMRRAPSQRRFGTWMLLGGPLTLALLVAFVTSVPISQIATGGGSYGLWQRALTIEIQAWYVAMGLLAIRRLSPTTRRSHTTAV
jgi:hypothetical membrane protein